MRFFKLLLILGVIGVLVISCQKKEIIKQDPPLNDFSKCYNKIIYDTVLYKEAYLAPHTIKDIYIEGNCLVVKLLQNLGSTSVTVDIAAELKHINSHLNSINMKLISDYTPTNYNPELNYFDISSLKTEDNEQVIFL